MSTPAHPAHSELRHVASEMRNLLDRLDNATNELTADVAADHPAGTATAPPGAVSNPVEAGPEVPPVTP